MAYRNPHSLSSSYTMPELSGRRRFMLLCFMLAAMGLVWRAVDLQVLNQDFLQQKGNAVYLRQAGIPAYRGQIQDRNGYPLAISAPVSSVWANPQEFEADSAQLGQLAELLEVPRARLRNKLQDAKAQRFVYLRRRMDPQLARQIDDLELSGVYLDKEYRRYYPDGEVVAHLLGFTNVDDRGQEGLELAFEEWLNGKPGSEQVIRDGKRRMVEKVERIRSPEPGKDLRLTIDRRLQYLAYRELKAAVNQHRARAGSLVLLDPRNGQVLAMANQPSFNPNNRAELQMGRTRNRALTDLFEPGSTIKAFAVAAGLESGRYGPQTLIDTTPGYMRVGRNLVRDHHNYGEIDVARVLLKSSNVGAAKIVLDISPERFWTLLDRLGFGQAPGSRFPGEASGRLVHFDQWRAIEQATLSFGYGMSTTALQLTNAYAALANDGVIHHPRLILDETPGDPQQVMRADTARSVRHMLEAVVSKQGTAPRAQVPGYRVAGKTGTVKKAVPGGYAEDRYLSIFAGMAPASDPRLVMVVVIDEPTSGDYYGGLVAGPVFSRVMGGALRMLGVTPDNIQSLPALAAVDGGRQ